MTYHIGQKTPLEGRYNITGGKLDSPVWYAMLVPPQKEHAARNMLRAKGIHAVYPENEVSYSVRGRKVSRKLPVVTRIVYAKFTHAPQWHALKARRLITGVFSWGDRPIPIPSDVIRAIMGLPTEAERLEEARREMLRVKDGDRARLIGGPLDGLVVNISEVKEGRAWFDTLTGVKGSAEVGKMERVVDY